MHQLALSFGLVPENRASGQLDTSRIAPASFLQNCTETISARRLARLGVVSSGFCLCLDCGKKSAGPRLRFTDRIATITNQNMASPDVVCQPCGSALGAPTKECSTAHKTPVPAEELAVGTRPRGYRMRNGRPSAHRKHLTSTEQPRSLRIATTRPAGTRQSRNFSSAVVAPHRAVTTVRARDVAPRKILVATTPH